MNSRLRSLALVIAVSAVSSLAACDLYFGPDHGGGGSDNWSYCGSDGYYTCQNNDCQWAGSTCPGGGSGYGCSNDKDCAAGCYCSNGGSGSGSSGTCEEGGFCGSDADCGPGYHCDVQRSSCVPDPGCIDMYCPSGQVCNEWGACVPSCTCTSDAQAVAAGYGWCDESSGTCEPGVDPNGSCGGAVTCTTAAPHCAAGEVPLVYNGCYTGQCRAIAQCDVTPSCAAIEHEADCLGRSTDCSTVYTGHGCHKANGTACHAGDTGCTCTSFTFDSCEDKGMSARLFIDSNGVRVDAASYLQE